MFIISLPINLFQSVTNFFFFSHLLFLDPSPSLSFTFLFLNICCLQFCQGCFVLICLFLTEGPYEEESGTALIIIKLNFKVWYSLLDLKDLVLGITQFDLVCQTVLLLLSVLELFPHFARPRVFCNILDVFSPEL